MTNTSLNTNNKSKTSAPYKVAGQCRMKCNKILYELSTGTSLPGTMLTQPLILLSLLLRKEVTGTTHGLSLNICDLKKCHLYLSTHCVDSHCPGPRQDPQLQPWKWLPDCSNGEKFKLEPPTSAPPETLTQTRTPTSTPLLRAAQSRW